MADAVADSSERLPWLPNAVSAAQRRRLQPRQPRRSWYPLLVAVSAVAAIAFGGSALVERGIAPAPAPVTPAETVPLPPPVASPPSDSKPQAPTAAEREALRPAPAEPVASTRPAKPTVRRSSTSTPAAARQRARPQAAAPTPAYDPRAWQSGVPGRIIQIGAYGTSAKAQSEWRRVYSRYPLLRPLSPRVIKSKIRGRTYHRLQLGTFSQAHSELLCQRLRATGQECIVLRLPARGRG